MTVCHSLSDPAFLRGPASLGPPEKRHYSDNKITLKGKDFKLKVNTAELTRSPVSPAGPLSPCKGTHVQIY